MTRSFHPSSGPSTSSAARARFLPKSNLPEVIPPRSEVILRSYDAARTPGWKPDIGRVFRIGYYNQQDGLDCVWLVNERGEYEQTTDRATLLRHFLILKLSAERDLFGEKRAPLKSLKNSGSATYVAGSLLA